MNELSSYVFSWSSTFTVAPQTRTQTPLVNSIINNNNHQINYMDHNTPIKSKPFRVQLSPVSVNFYSITHWTLHKSLCVIEKQAKPLQGGQEHGNFPSFMLPSISHDFTNSLGEKGTITLWSVVVTHEIIYTYIQHFAFMQNYCS